MNGSSWKLEVILLAPLAMILPSRVSKFDSDPKLWVQNGRIRPLSMENLCKSLLQRCKMFLLNGASWTFKDVLMVPLAIRLPSLVSKFDSDLMLSVQIGRIRIFQRLHHSKCFCWTDWTVNWKECCLSPSRSSNDVPFRNSTRIRCYGSKSAEFRPWCIWTIFMFIRLALPCNFCALLCITMFFLFAIWLWLRCIRTPWMNASNRRPPPP